MSLSPRRKKAGHFTIVGNHAARDPALSLKAKGLLLLLLSFSEGWTYRLGHIGTLSSDKEHATRSALHELMKARYVVRQKKRSEDGTFEWIYTVTDKPLTTPSETTPPFSTDGSSTDGSSTDGSSTDGSSTDGSSTDGKSSHKKIEARKARKKIKERRSTKEIKETPSAAHAAGRDAYQGLLDQDCPDVPPVASPAAQGTPDGMAADAADQTPSNLLAEPQPPTRGDIEASSPEEGSAGPRRAAPEHQAMMNAIREAIYPGIERCADNIEGRLAAASRQLRSAGLDSSAPASIAQHIHARHPWRTSITPQTLVEHSAEWASAQVNPPPTGLALTGSSTQARSIGRPQTTDEANQRSADTSTALYTFLQNRGNQP